MKRPAIILSIFFVLISVMAFSQDRLLTSQYYQNLPAHSPAFTGANDFLDIRLGYRSQWSGFEGSPTLAYLSGYTPINTIDRSNKGVRSGKFFPGESTKLAAGGYVLTDQQAAISQIEAMGNFAVHLRFSGNRFLSLGTSMGIYATSIDVEQLTARDAANDPTYQAYINGDGSSSFFNLNASLGYYSDNLYFSYGMEQLTQQMISGNALLENEGNIKHQVLAGLKSKIGRRLELVSSVYYRNEKDLPAVVDLGVRARYKKIISAGLSYRNDNSVISMFGVTFGSLSFNYSYDYKPNNFNRFNQFSHEIVIGIKLLNNGNDDTIW